MLLILLTIFLSRKIVRHPIFVNFCITWMLFALSYSLLFYAGQIENQFPPFSLCVTQSAMVYGSPAMIGVSVLVFVLHLYLVLRGSVRQISPPRWPKLRLVSMLAAPYLVFMLVFLVAIISGNSQPHLVRRSSLYCTISLRIVTNLSAGISAAAVITSLVIEILTAITLHRHWRSFRTNAKNGLSISILIRTLIVLIFSVIALVTCMAFLANLGSIVPNMVLACLPMAAFLVFGTQSDFIRAWCFWRRDGSFKDTIDHSSSIASESSLVVKKV